MKKELKKTIRQLCDEVGSDAAAAKAAELTENLTDEYDRRVEAGMAELDAYRDVLKNIDKIREMLESLPQTEEEIDRRSRDAGRKNLERMLGKLSGCMWLCTVIVYFFVSLTWGGWPVTWLIFLWSVIGQILFNMVKKYNRGKPLKKILKSGLSGILWMLVVMVYIFLSFWSGAWHLTWLIFLLGALAQVALGLFWGDNN